MEVSMALRRCIFLLTVFALATARNMHGPDDFPGLHKLLKSQMQKASPSVQAQAARDLIRRIVPSQADSFNVSVDFNIGPDHNDTYKLSANNGKVEIIGSSGVAVAMGFNFYLKYFCNSSISWCGDHVSLPSLLPTTNGLYIMKTHELLRYYQNVVTVSYSSAWWDWARWQREIDWMAMNGINFPLSFTAQEEIWRRVYGKIGLTTSELDSHFGGPAFLAWARMGNLRGWGGPLPASWYPKQLALQHLILNATRSLGMVPVLPGFAGHVPAAIHRVYPNVSLSRMGDWGHFNDTYCCTYLLSPTEPLFTVIGKAFIQEMQMEFGVDHVYNADTFNEMSPKSRDPKYLASVANATYNSMKAGDPQAVWLMQGWLFLEGFWTPKLAKAYISAVPKGRMIILDVGADKVPQFKRLDSFFGQYWIWCMVHNNGGVIGIQGQMGQVNTGVVAGRFFPNSSMIGTGLTMEGINQNPVVYEFMNELAWRDQPLELIPWMERYPVFRYGVQNKLTKSAWTNLLASAYNRTGSARFHGKAVVVMRPSFDLTPLPSPKVQNVKSADAANLFFKAWDQLFQSHVDPKTDTYRYDLVDVTRECLQKLFGWYFMDFKNYYNIGSIALAREKGESMMGIIQDMDTLLNSNEHFLLGVWLNNAKSYAANPQELKLLEYNARNQITLWGQKGEPALLFDYARKQWAGMMADYYGARWSLFFVQVLDAMAAGRDFDQDAYNTAVFNQVEQPFTVANKNYPDTPTGDTMVLVEEIRHKYMGKMKKYAAKYKCISSDTPSNDVWPPSEISNDKNY